MNKKLELFLASAFGAGICVLIAFALGTPSWLKGLSALTGGVFGAGLAYRPREVLRISKEVFEETFKRDSRAVLVKYLKKFLYGILLLVAFFSSWYFFSVNVAHDLFNVPVEDAVGNTLLGAFAELMLGGVAIMLNGDEFLEGTFYKFTLGKLAESCDRTIDDTVTALMSPRITLLFAILIWPVIHLLLAVVVVCGLLGILEFIRLVLIAVANGFLALAKNERISAMAGAFTGGLWYLVVAWGSPDLLLPLLFAMAIGGSAGVASHFFSAWMQKKLGVEKIPYRWECLGA